MIDRPPVRTNPHRIEAGAQGTTPSVEIAHKLLRMPKSRSNLLEHALNRWCQFPAQNPPSRPSVNEAEPLEDPPGMRSRGSSFTGVFIMDIFAVRLKASSSIMLLPSQGASVPEAFTATQSRPPVSKPIRFAHACDMAFNIEIILCGNFENK